MQPNDQVPVWHIAIWLVLGLVAWSAFTWALITT